MWLHAIYYRGIDRAARAGGGDTDKPDPALVALRKATEQRAQAHPKSAAAHIMHAMVFVNQAWAFRGNGYANTIDRERLMDISLYIIKARQYLETHKSVAAGDPQWYQVMITIAMLQNWDRPKFDRLLNEALDREPLYYQTYFKAAEYLLPKWHGNIDELEAFAQRAAIRTSATEGGGMYARIYWYANQQQFNDRLFLDSRVSWPRMRDGFDDIIQRYPDAWNLNNYAKFACLAKDKQKTRELTERIGIDTVPAAWSSETQRVNCTRWAAHAS